MKAGLRRLWARSLRWQGWPVAVAMAVLLLTLLFWQRQQRSERLQAQAVVDASLHEAVLRLQQRLLSYELLLQSTQAFVLAQASGDARSFKHYVDMLPLGAELAGVQGLGLARWLPEEQRLPVQRQWQREGRGLMLIQPGGVREAYAPVTQLEPDVPRNQAALGRDLLAEPALRDALLLARDSGHMALSSRLPLAPLLPGAPDGLLMVLPLYDSSSPPSSTLERRQTLRGWIWAPVAVGELMASVYAELPRHLRLRLYEGQVLSEEAALFDSGGGIDASARRVQEYLDVGGRTWTLSLQLGEHFAAGTGMAGAPLVLGSGALLAALLGLLCWSLLHSNERAQGLAERMTQALRESEQRWAFALDGSGDGMWDWHIDSGRIDCSPRWKAIMGWQAGEPQAQRVLSLVHPDDLPRVRADFIHCLKGHGQTLQSEFRVADEHSGDWNWVLARGRVVSRDAQQWALRMIGTLSDINARRLSEERVRFMASHDALTELANRAHFGERMHYALANARRYGDSLGLILLDLDRFKPINDQYGHAVGDQLLQMVAKRLRNAVRETDVVGRIGGDEFVVLLTGPVTRGSAQVVVDKIFNQVAQPMELSGVRIELTCSIGLALYPDDGQDEISLTKAADAAMYRRKHAGRAWLGG
ncbi:GGDEF domain-containing protein [Paucibacter sp. APW11]|uniref:GGDEF domain-containing protein n=1 Tax=Roseateles aquae TaxID=3077235 RepID=A0ABU3PH77_9BURK|nr:GGDEF domain-containing protein [Paucibacter sp. APW11]MDT9001893.1 GGDEF domain-containing protein [Paucibacter sp. APW11]